MGPRSLLIILWNSTSKMGNLLGLILTAPADTRGVELFRHGFLKGVQFSELPQGKTQSGANDVGERDN